MSQNGKKVELNIWISKEISLKKKNRRLKMRSLCWKGDNFFQKLWCPNIGQLPPNHAVLYILVVRRNFSFESSLYLRITANFTTLWLTWSPSLLIKEAQSEKEFSSLKISSKRTSSRQMSLYLFWILFMILLQPDCKMTFFHHSSAASCYAILKAQASAISPFISDLNRLSLYPLSSLWVPCNYHHAYLVLCGTSYGVCVDVDISWRWSLPSFYFIPCCLCSVHLLIFIFLSFWKFPQFSNCFVDQDWSSYYLQTSFLAFQICERKFTVNWICSMALVLSQLAQVFSTTQKAPSVISIG